MSIAEELSDFDYYDTSLPPRYYETFATIRAGCPVLHSRARGGYWLVSKYDDVKTVLSDHATYSSACGVEIPESAALPMPPIATDPPLHRDFRTLLNRFFSPRRLADHEAAIRAMAVTRAEALVRKGGGEIVGEFAGPFTGEVLAAFVLGLDPDAERDQIAEAARLAEDIGKLVSVEAWMRLSELVNRLLAERREENLDRDDLIGALLTGSVEGRSISHDEAVGCVMLMFAAGLDTTKAAIANIVWRMTQQPELEDRVRDPKWAQTDIDEFLRLDSPITGLSRRVAVDTVLNGQHLKAGDWVWVHYSSANRDEDVFEDADGFVPDREANPHVAFGLGIHRCIGSNLARMELIAAMDALLSRVRNVRLDGDVEFLPGVVRHPRALNITFDRV